MALEAYSLVEVMAEACRRQNADWEDIALRMTNLGLDPSNAVDIVNANFGADVLTANLNAGGGANVWYYPRETIQSWDASLVGEVSGDSNLAVVNRANVQVPINTSIDQTTGKVTFSTTPKTVPTGMNSAQWLITNTSQAFNAASMGIFLGKTIDGLLYNANPDYWDSIGMSSLNPETWASITSGDDSFGAYLFNTVFGIDPDTGKTQAYIDADSAAYMAYALAQNDWFVSGQKQYVFDTDTGTWPSNWPNVIPTSNISTMTTTNGALTYVIDSLPDGWIPVFVFYPDRYTASGMIFCVILHIGDVPSPTVRYHYTYNGRRWDYSSISNRAVARTKNDNITFTICTLLSNAPTTGPYVSSTNIYLPAFTPNVSGSQGEWIGTGIFEGTYEETGAVQGVGNQPNAQLPDTSTWSDIPSTDAYLRSSYPDAYSDAVQFDSVQPDGTVLTKTFIPVPMPDVINNDMTKPISDIDSSSQTQPYVDVDTATNTLIDTLTKILQKPKTETETQIDTITPPSNPVDTGSGNSPTLIPITGSSSALWSVYNPTKAQIDSFGAWLWTDNVIQQFIQLLNNPMEGIITLHKIFAPPVVSGAGTIVVGRLDSGVSSNLVAQQYANVDCGSINIDEYFGNVFDYSPYTTISLYLPFIGFVPLNVDDVMRSTISINYGVDVFTGACLATVNVDRDDNSVGLYQYSGVASVEYPLTGAQHGGLVNGLLGVAGGIAGIALASTGVGFVAGASAIAGGLANAAKSSNARSGGFSGNAGAMGVKIPYLIIERPITKVADNFDVLNGYPTNHNARLGDCSGNVVVKYVHVDGMYATEDELSMIETQLKNGVVV